MIFDLTGPQIAFLVALGIIAVSSVVLLVWECFQAAEGGCCDDDCGDCQTEWQR